MGEINGCNGMLQTSLGRAHQALGSRNEALKYFTKAVEISSKAGGSFKAFAMFYQGVALNTLLRHEEAVSVLSRAKAESPREASIHLELGRSYVGLKNSRLALKHFTAAMDLCSAKGSKDYELLSTAKAEL